MHIRIVAAAVLVAVVAGTTASAAAEPRRPSKPDLTRAGAPAAAYLPPRTAAAGDPHEVRLELAEPGSGGAWTYQPVGPLPAVPEDGGSDAANGLLVDPALVAPARAIWFWRAPLRLLRGYRACVRLYDASIQQPVANSEMCLALPADWPTEFQTWVYDSRPVTLNAGNHVYVLQAVRTAGPEPHGMPSLPRGAELVARWTE